MLKTLRWAGLGLGLVVNGTEPVAAQTAASGFQDAVFTSGVSQPSGLAFAPDGRLFVLQKAAGRVRIVKNGSLLATPFLDVHDFILPGQYFDTYFERGLLGLAFDPGFPTNHFVYLYYTVCEAPKAGGTPGTGTGCTRAVNRVARVVANGDGVVPNTHTVLLDGIPNDAGNHNAGWIGFGPADGKLYVTVGDGGQDHTTSQRLDSLDGKVLRLNADGSVPADNPYVGQAGARPEVWASGLRNPFRASFAPNGRLFVTDVGENTWEEVDVVIRGANFGWPTTEGSFSQSAFPAFTLPFYTYNHNGHRAAIIAGEFGARTNYPGDAQQSFFFADYGLGVVRRLVLDTAGTHVLSVQDLVTGIGMNTVTHLVGGPDGSLYYTNYATGTVHRVTALSGNHSPVAVASATPGQGRAPLRVQFSSAGTADADGDPLTYRWDFGDGSAPATDPNPTHSYAARGLYTVTLTVSDGKPAPGPGTATLAVTVGDPPAVQISTPADGEIHRAGDTIVLQGSAVDPVQGPLPPGALHWKVIFHHNDHTHPFIDDLVGSPQSFEWAPEGESDPNVGYEIILSATDSAGLTGSQSIEILPLLQTFTLQTSPPGLQLTLDGQPMATPVTVSGVVGFLRPLGAPSPQSDGTQLVAFTAWSDGGPEDHTIATPENATTYTAAFANACAAPTVIPAAGGRFLGATNGDSTLAGTCGQTDTAPEQVYQWTPAASGTAVVQTCGGSTSFDTVLYIRSGTCRSGATIACNDDTAGCATTEPNDHHASRISTAVTAGQTYFIVVDGFNGKSGTYTLTVTPPAGTPGTTTTTIPSTSTTSNTTTTSLTSTTLPGTCAAPAVVPAEGGRFLGRTSGSGALSGSCAPTAGSGEEIFQWTPAVSGVATLATCGTATGFDTVLYVRRDACTGTEVACNDDTAGCGTSEPSNHHASTVQLSVAAGTTYFIVVDGYNGAQGNFALTVTPPAGTATTTSTTPAPASTSTSRTTAVTTSSTTTSTTPAAGSCNAPVALPAAGGSFSGVTAGATAQSGSCGGVDTAPEQVFAWTPALSGRATIATCGSQTSFDTVLYVRTDACTAGSEVACNDDTAGCSTGEPNTHHGSRVSLPVVAGRTYFLIVDGYGGAHGNFLLTVTPPPTGTCAQPTAIPASGGTFTGVTAGTSAESGSCGGTTSSPEQVYVWTPSASGSATIQTCGPGTGFDTVLYLRAGACTASAEVACNDDTPGCGTGEPSTSHGSRLDPIVTAGQTYYIVVDGFGGKSGPFTLTVTAPGSAGSTTTSSSTVPPSSTSTSVTTPPSTSTTSTRPTTTTSSTTSTTLPVGTCTNPQPIPASGGTFTGTTSGASAQTGSCSIIDNSPEWTFRWTPARSGTATITTCNAATSFDTVIYMRTAGCTSGTELACDDDTCDDAIPHKGSRITPKVTAGQPYDIVVDGYNGAKGSFSLVVTPP